MLLELEGDTGDPPVDTVLRKYTWGLDLAGLNGAGVAPANGRWSDDPSRDRQGAGFAGSAGLPPRRTGSGAALQGAGGIGGLLAMQAPGAGPGAGDLNAVYTYDASGNVGQLVAWATGFGGAQGDEWHMDRLVAHYEYDPHGGVTAQSGNYADANPVRYSTKYWDDETGLGYWGYRYYSPSLGRWLNRDPLGEAGGMNLYTYVSNDPLGHFDPTGKCGAILTCSSQHRDILAARCRELPNAIDEIIHDIEVSIADPRTDGDTDARLRTARNHLRSVLNVKRGRARVWCVGSVFSVLCGNALAMAFTVTQNDILICPRFWTQVRTPNAQRGVLVHELVHLVGPDDGPDNQTYFQHGPPRDVGGVGWQYIADTYRYWHDCGFCVPGHPAPDLGCTGGCRIE